MAAENKENETNENETEENKNDDALLKKIKEMPDIVEHTPLNKLNNNLAPYLLQETKHDYTFAILLTTGSLNPIHLGHVDIMESAKIEIEKTYKNIKVIGGFMSPSHDGYLSGKFGRNKFIPSKHRIKMVKMATNDSNWITYDEWECKQDYFIDFPSVSSRCIKKLRRIYIEKYKYIKSGKLEIFYCCGLDHAEKCGLLQGRLHRIQVNTLIVRRPNTKLNHIKMKSNLKKGVIVVDLPPVHYDRSSTIVRNLILSKKWKELEKYLNPNVLNYLKDDPDKVISKIK